jgi:hypothetical protein
MNGRAAKVAWVLLFLCVARVWLMALPSSLWVDELVTLFVVRHPGHASFAVAPQVPLSIYYWLPRASLAMFGSSEIALRLPSVLAMLCTLLFVARIAVRTIHASAAWFAVFAALAFRNFDYFAVDARPYGLGMAVASASVLFLVRWLDGARVRDGVLFAALAGALWWVHLFYWPFYLLYTGYAGIRFARRDTAVKVWQAYVAAGAIGCAIAPVALTALRISREAGAHAFNELPTLRNLFYLAHGFPILICLALAWGLARVRRWRSPGVSRSGFMLALIWWLVCPVCLFAYSKLSGNGVLIMRYASLMLPGIALTVTAIVGAFLPAANWRAAALCTGVVALALTGDWTHLWPAHEHDDWRDAAAWERTLASDDTPVLCPSPFVEAQPPVWKPDYPVVSFLYSHLEFYTIRGHLKLLPFQPAPESERYLDALLRSDLLPAGRFVEYGSTRKVEALDRWVSRQPELAGWRRESREFDNLSVVIYVR